MEYCTSSWILTIILFLILQKNVNAISCYICSWSPEDREVESDRCSGENFDERRVRSEECKHGCEVVKIYDSNGELLMFYRNCLMKSPTKLDYDSSHKKASLMTKEEMYACESDLCNSSASRHAILGVLITSLLFSTSSHSFL